MNEDIKIYKNKDGSINIRIKGTYGVMEYPKIDPNKVDLNQSTENIISQIEAL